MRRGANWGEKYKSRTFCSQRSFRLIRCLPKVLT